LEVFNDFDDWAAVSARLRGHDESGQASILASLGIAAQWPRANAHWRSTLIADMANGEFDRAFRYREACAYALKHPLPLPGAQTVSVNFDGSVGGSSKDGDFRSELMAGAPEPKKRVRPALAQPTEEGGCFIDELAPPVMRPTPPKSSQQSTAANLKHVRAVALAAKRLCKCSTEDYAELCAKLEHAPQKQKVIWAQRGVVGKATIHMVTSTWRKRFSENPTLEAEWRNLVDGYRERLEEP